MPLLTIYTPTYNRAYTLPRVYESLCRQTCKDFLWLVIDDGSTDNTRELIEGWMAADNGFEIRYRHKKNEGTHTARDMAYREADTELVVANDSDDWMMDDAAEKIVSLWKKEGSEKYAGIIAKTTYINENIKAVNLPNVHSATVQELVYKYHFKNERITVLRSDIIKAIPDAPVFEGEKLVGEGYKWIQLPNDKPFLLLNERLWNREIVPDSFSVAAYNNVFKNTHGFYENFRQHIISALYLKEKFRSHIGYIACGIMLKDRHCISKSPQPIVSALLLPFGVAGYFYFKARRWYGTMKASKNKS